MILWAIVVPTPGKLSNSFSVAVFILISPDCANAKTGRRKKRRTQRALQISLCIGDDPYAEGNQAEKAEEKLEKGPVKITHIFIV